MTEIYFYGAIGGMGNDLFDADGAMHLPILDTRKWRTTRGSVITLPWHRLDSSLCPGTRFASFDGVSNEVPRQCQIEGNYAVHHADGWTAMAWWDRSGCSLHWSNSALVARGTFTAAKMLAMGSTMFASTMARMRYEFRPGVYSILANKTPTFAVTDPHAVALSEHNRASFLRAQRTKARQAKTRAQTKSIDCQVLSDKVYSVNM